MWWPAIGGLAVGLGGLAEPRALGVGYDSIRAMIAGRASGRALVGLVVVKALIWSFSLGSGTSGGVLAPLLIMGGGIGALAGAALPGAPPGLPAVVGMGAIVGGAMRSPLTAIVFMVELTHDVDALLPLLLAATVAFAVTVLVMRRSILTEKVARRGHHVVREYAVDPLEIHRVDEVMTREVATLPADMRVGDAVRLLTEISAAADPSRRHQGYPIVDAEGRVLGMVTRGDALAWALGGVDPGRPLAEAVEAPALVGYPDEPLARLADRMAVVGVGRVPIVSRVDGRLLGIVSRRDLLRARSRQFALESERRRVLGPLRERREPAGARPPAGRGSPRAG
jgi:CIC family chloride channel protein